MPSNRPRQISAFERGKRGERILESPRAVGRMWFQGGPSTRLIVRPSLSETGHSACIAGKDRPDGRGSGRLTQTRRTMSCWSPAKPTCCWREDEFVYGGVVPEQDLTLFAWPLTVTPRTSTSKCPDGWMPNPSPAGRLGHRVGERLLYTTRRTA
jgi:hypothetical protein